MRLAYFDCFSGMSGEMALAAMIHAGGDLQEIARTIAGLVTRYVADVSKARRLLGYDPQVPLTAGIPRYVAWWREQGWL